VKTISIRTRKSKVTPRQFAVPLKKGDESFARFVEGLPDILVAHDLRLLVDEIVGPGGRGSRPDHDGRPCDQGGSRAGPDDLMRRKVITALAMNSAASIHDVETALWGKTSEDVAVNMLDGRFGMARETGEFINGTLAEACRTTDMGYGEALGAKLVEVGAKNADVSVLASAYTMGVPVTVHAAIGTDIIHQQPQCMGQSRRNVVPGIPDTVRSMQTADRRRGGAEHRQCGDPSGGLSEGAYSSPEPRRPRTGLYDRGLRQELALPSHDECAATADAGWRKGLYFIGHHEIMVPLLVR